MQHASPSAALVGAPYSAAQRSSRCRASTDRPTSEPHPRSRSASPSSSEAQNDQADHRDDDFAVEELVEGDPVDYSFVHVQYPDVVQESDSDSPSSSSSDDDEQAEASLENQMRDLRFNRAGEPESGELDGMDDAVPPPPRLSRPLKRSHSQTIDSVSAAEDEHDEAHSTLSDRDLGADTKRRRPTLQFVRCMSESDDTLSDDAMELT